MLLSSHTRNALTSQVHQIAHDTLTITLKRGEKQESCNVYKHDPVVHPRWVDFVDNTCYIAVYLTYQP